ncbi:MAG: glutathione S-transferase family protein [Myxococcota bacterium]
MGYILYGAYGSGSSTVEAVLAELGVEWRMHVLDVRNDEHKGEAYSAVNPHGKMPSLRTPAGETLTESVAITLTLAERHPDAGIMPPTASPERAQVLRWLLFAASELYPLVELFDHPERFVSNDSDQLETRALEKWRARWSLVERSLGPGPYLLGEEFSLADVHIAALSRWDLDATFRAAHPRIENLARSVALRPAIRPVWLRNFPSFAPN